MTGAAKYAADIRLADMLYARILRPPVHGAVLIQADTTAAEKLPGAKIVRLDDLIAVLHADPEAAAAALAQIHADWRQPETTLNQDTIFEHLRSHAGAAKQIAAKGDLAAAPLAKAFETIFEKGYVAHAPIEPHAAIADVRADGATIWASTQTPFPIRDAMATIAEVRVDKTTGQISVVRMVCAQDMGVVVNPEGAKMQIEGGLTMGLGYALSEELRFQGGAVLDRSFGTYHLPRLSAVPKIEVVLVRNDDVAPQGCGEPAITTAGGAIANAVFDASGARLLRLPMTPKRVVAALAAAEVRKAGKPSYREVRRPA